MEDVVKGQSQTQARQIRSATIPCMTAEEWCELMVKLCADNEYQLILALDECCAIATADVEHKEACAMLGLACRNGNLDLAVWLANQFEFRTQDILTRLGSVCAGGHVQIMKWMTDRFRLTAAHIRARSVLLNACRSGDLDFVRWVVERFGLTARDARVDHHRLLWCVCASGRVQMTTWIVEHFGLGRPGSCPSLVSMKRYASIYITSDDYYLRAIRWLEKMQAVRLGSRGCQRLLWYAIKHKHINVIRWMAHRYDLTQKDLALLVWGDRWLNSVQDAVWTEAGDVVAVQWPEEIVRGGW